MENTEKKIWGQYSTYKHPEQIASLSEEDIWKKIDNLGTILSKIARNPYARISKKTFLNQKYNLEFLVYLTRRFGVVFDIEPTESIEVENSESFKSWFSFWKSYFENMSKEEYEKFVEAKYYGIDVSSFLPSKSWKETTSNIK